MFCIGDFLSAKSSCAKVMSRMGNRIKNQTALSLPDETKKLTINIQVETIDIIQRCGLKSSDSVIVKNSFSMPSIMSKKRAAKVYSLR